MRLAKDQYPRKCSIEYCGGEHVARGLCNKHYSRLKRNGSPDIYLIKINSCKVDGCEARRARQGYCSRHWGYFSRHGTATPDSTIKLRFNSKSFDEAYEHWVIRHEPDECWGWSGWTNNTGYGYFSCHGEKKAAHRYSYEKYVGKINDGLHVLHKCDNPPCSNFQHLFLGTMSDNIKDAYAKGRRKPVPAESIPRGDSCYLSKLTSDQVIEIKKMIKNGKRNTEIAKIYGVIHQTISCIRNNKTWKHLGENLNDNT